MEEDQVTAPARLRALVSWQANRVNILGTRLTGARLPATGRADFAVLAALEEHGATSQADLGRQLGLDRNTINAIATRLDERGQIARSTDASDRRRNTVTITEVGRQYLDALQTATDAVQAELVAPLDPEERRELHRLLGKIIDAHPPLPA